MFVLSHPCPPLAAPGAALSISCPAQGLWILGIWGILGFSNALRPGRGGCASSASSCSIAMATLWMQLHPSGCPWVSGEVWRGLACSRPPKPEGQGRTGKDRKDREGQSLGAARGVAQLDLPVGHITAWPLLFAGAVTPQSEPLSLCPVNACCFGAHCHSSPASLRSVGTELSSGGSRGAQADSLSQADLVG